MIKNNRRSIRLKDYNYAQRGMYFITICSHNRTCIFGKIVDGCSKLSELGHIVERYWKSIPAIHNHIETDLFVIMPNHLHGIIYINGPQNVPIGSILRTFKAQVTRTARSQLNIKSLWQRNYYEHVIRDDVDYERIAQYILNNPLSWEIDSLNPNIIK